MIFYLKYFSAITIVTAIVLHAFNYHPWNVMVHLVGACTWTIVGFAWKEKSILLNFSDHDILHAQYQRLYKWK